MNKALAEKKDNKLYKVGIHENSMLLLYNRYRVCLHFITLSRKVKLKKMWCGGTRSFRWCQIWHLNWPKIGIPVASWNVIDKNAKNSVLDAHSDRYMGVIFKLSKCHSKGI